MSELVEWGMDMEPVSGPAEGSAPAQDSASGVSEEQLIEKFSEIYANVFFTDMVMEQVEENE